MRGCAEADQALTRLRLLLDFTTGIRAGISFIKDPGLIPIKRLSNFEYGSESMRRHQACLSFRMR